MPKLIQRGSVELVKLYPDPFHDDTMNAHVKQSVSTVYESERGPFVKSQAQSYQSDRYTFVPVPADWDEARVQAAVKDGTIRRTFGCIPASVMSKNQLARLNSLSGQEGQDLYDRIMNNITSVDAETGEVIQFEGHDSFGRNEFVLGRVEDIDLRPQDVASLSTMDSDPVFEQDSADQPLQVAK